MLFSGGNSESHDILRALHKVCDNIYIFLPSLSHRNNTSWTYLWLLSLVQTFSHKYIMIKCVVVGILHFLEDIAKVHRFEEYVLSHSNVMAVTVQIVQPIIVS